MDETRRNLIKGMLTSGTLLAFGIPTVSQAMSISQTLSDSTRNCQLLLGNTPIDEAFARGAQAACTSYINHHQSVLPAFKLEDELLTNPLRIVDLLTQSRNMRWIAVMDHASAAIFTELVRNLEGRLLSLGSHSSSGDDTSFPNRHIWTTAASMYSAGGLLASLLFENRQDFFIVENFLEQMMGESAIKSPLLAGFATYQRVAQPATRLHCAGVSPQEASRIIGWKASENWKSISFHADQSSAYHDKTASDAAIKHPQFDNWIEATGYAVVASALGMGINQQPCASCAFVHRSDQRNPDHRGLPGKHFVSFVIDV